MVERIGAVAYKLELPSTVNIHPVFHVSQLRKAIGSILPKFSVPLTLQAHGPPSIQPTNVLGVQRVGPTVTSSTDFEVLIQWDGLTVRNMGKRPANHLSISTLPP